MDKIRGALDILRTDTKYDADAKEYLDIVTIGIRQYDELLAYVRELEKIAAEGTAGGDIPFSARSIRPKFLRSVSESLCKKE